MEIRIRPVELTDADALRRVCWTGIDATQAQERLDLILSPAGRSRSWGLVALVKGAMVGFGQITRWGWRGEIANLDVGERWRGKGIGTALIRHLILIAYDQGMSEIEIGAAERNTRALALYRRLGFVEERRAHLDLGQGVEIVVYLIMRLGHKE